MVLVVLRPTYRVLFVSLAPKENHMLAVTTTLSWLDFLLIFLLVVLANFVSGRL